MAQLASPHIIRVKDSMRVGVVLVLYLPWHGPSIEFAAFLNNKLPSIWYPDPTFEKKIGAGLIKVTFVPAHR